MLISKWITFGAGNDRNAGNTACNNTIPAKRKSRGKMDTKGINKEKSESQAGEETELPRKKKNLQSALGTNHTCGPCTI